MRRLVAVVALVAAGCTAQQTAVFQTLTPAQQASVAAGLYRPDETGLYVPPGGFLACVRRHESGGDYRAENPTSSASGAYQFIDSTWRYVSTRAGRGGYGHASWAPPAVQDAVAVDVVRRGERWHWNGTGCR